MVGLWEVAIDQRKLKITCPLCLGSSRPEIPGERERRARPGAAFLYIDPMKLGPVLPGSHQSKSSWPPWGAAVREQVLILTLPEGRGEIKSLFFHGSRLVYRKRSKIPPSVESFHCFNNS